MRVLVALLLGLAGCGQPGPDRVPPLQVTRVEAIACDRPQPRLGVGTVVADGIVLTAAHVVDGNLRELRVDDESATVVGIDVESDLALLAVAGPHDPDPSWLASPVDDVVAGSARILTPDGPIDAALVRSLTLRVEDISGGPTTERRAVELAVIVDEGDSGSPVVDDHGRLLAVVVLRRPSTGVSYASRIPAFADLLDTALYQDVVGTSGVTGDGRSLARVGRCT